MNRSTGHLTAAAIALSICLLFFGNARAQEALVFVGAVNTAGQLETVDAKLLEIATTREGNRLIEAAGRKVEVTGVVEEKDGTNVIEVTSFKVLDE